MKLSLLQKCALGLSGVTALGVGAFILAAPHAFYQSYGISLGNDINLLSELRAPAAGLAASGLLMMAGILWRSVSHVSMVVALMVFLAFPAGRIVGLLIDGMPSGNIVAALVFELVIATLCLTAFRHRLKPTAGHRDRLQLAA